MERWGEYKLCIGGLCPFNTFFMLKTTFSKHQLIKISITHVYIKPKVDTKMIQQKWIQEQRKLV